MKFIVNEAVKDESKRDLARCAEMVEACFESNDYIEGRRAFMEKRKPAFTGNVIRSCEAPSRPIGLRTEALQAASCRGGRCRGLAVQ